MKILEELKAERENINSLPPPWNIPRERYGRVMDDAAKEIERLAAELAQLKAAGYKESDLNLNERLRLMDERDKAKAEIAALKAKLEVAVIEIKNQRARFKYEGFVGGVASMDEALARIEELGSKA